MADETIDETVTTEPVATARAFGSPGARFVLGEELGRGGMGRVVAARDVALEREVAIKQVLTDDRELIARFEREVRITAQLEHPSIVALHEAGRDSADLPFYVMRRIAGVALAERLAVADGVRERLALVPSVLAVVDAAAFAHAKRIVHRDIKPGNIMLGPYGEAYLIDWGIARRLDDPTESMRGAKPALDDLTHAGQLFGTVAYMAPEQARGEAVDERADVFALGATLFHVLAGRAPFGGLSAAERIAQAVEGERPLAQLPEEVPRDLVAIVAVAMASDRGARYRDAGELARDLRAFLAGQLVAARHYSAAQRAARFLRKHAIAVAAITAVAVAALVFGIVTIRGIVEARREADEARRSAELNEQQARAQAMDSRLKRAAALVATDPTRGALLARDLLRAPTIDHRERAEDIVHAAAGMGIARGARIPHDPPVNGAISPDGRSVAVSGRLGSVYVFDLPTGAVRRLTKLSSLLGLVLWPEADTLVGIDDGLVTIDVATGAVRRLAVGRVDHAWYVPRRRTIRYTASAAHELREIAIGGGSPTVLARDVDVAQGLDERALIVGSGALRLVSPEGELVLARDVPSVEVHRLALAASGRVAASLGNRVHAWTSDGREVDSWPLDQVHEVRFLGDRLYAIALAGVARLFDRTPYATLLDRTTSGNLNEAVPLALLTHTTGGVAYGFTDGRVYASDSRAVRRLPHELDTMLRLVGSPSSPYLVALFNRGDVRWWNVGDLAVRNHPLPKSDANGGLCWSSGDETLVTGWGTAAVIDRAKNTVRNTMHPYFALPTTCHGKLGDTVFMTDVNARTARLDLVRGDFEIAALPSGFIVDATVGAIVFARDRQLLELPGGRGPERVRWTAPAPISIVAATSGRYAAVAGGEIHRVDVTTGAAQVVAPVAPDWVAIDEGGTVYWTGGLALWSRRPEAMIPDGPHALSARVTFTVALHGEGLVLELADGSSWVATPRGVIAGSFGARTAPAVDRSGRVAVKMYDRITIHHIKTSVSLGFTMPGAHSLMFDTEGRLVIMLGNSLVTWRPPSHGMTDLDAWLDGATNAKLVVGDIVEWPGFREGD